jgi:hypothetical protein
MVVLEWGGVVAEGRHWYCGWLLHDGAGNVGWARDGDIGRGRGGVAIVADGEDGRAWAVGDVSGDGIGDWWENHSDEGHLGHGAHLGAGAVLGRGAGV